MCSSVGAMYVRCRLPSATTANNCEPIRPARPSDRTCAKGTGVSQTMHVAPDRPTVPSIGGPPAPKQTSNRTVLPSATGWTHASLPFLLLSQNERTSGIVAPQAGLGHVTVRAQIHAITVACDPSASV